MCGYSPSVFKKVVDYHGKTKYSWKPGENVIVLNLSPVCVLVGLSELMWILVRIVSANVIILNARLSL